MSEKKKPAAVEDRSGLDQRPDGPDQKAKAILADRVREISGEVYLAKSRPSQVDFLGLSDALDEVAKEIEEL